MSSTIYYVEIYDSEHNVHIHTFTSSQKAQAYVLAGLYKYGSAYIKDSVRQAYKITNGGQPVSIFTSVAVVVKVS